jgi:hypothetical protein
MASQIGEKVMKWSEQAFGQQITWLLQDSQFGIATS